MLFRSKNSYFVPVQEKWDRIESDFRYHSLSSAISSLINKYKVRQFEIEEEIRKRTNEHYGTDKHGINPEDLIKKLTNIK